MVQILIGRTYVYLLGEGYDNGMVYVGPGSRSPIWSQNEVKIFIDR